MSATLTPTRIQEIEDNFDLDIRVSTPSPFQPELKHNALPIKDGFTDTCWGSCIITACPDTCICSGLCGESIGCV